MCVLQVGRTPSHLHTLTPSHTLSMVHPHTLTPSHTLSMVHLHTLTLSHLHTRTLS